MGFVRERWWELDAGLREMIATYDAMDSPGYPERRFIVRGQLHGPKESHLFRTVWALGQGAVAPRFLSAYPR
jgi:hypothetical protein